MKILVGPEECFAGSHFTLTAIEGAPTFQNSTDFFDAIDYHQPDVVFLRAVSANGITPEMITRCPVPVVGFYHDWICWGVERLEAVYHQVDWLITEKTAYKYLKSRGLSCCSHFLLMSHGGIEKVIESKRQAVEYKKYDVGFLGAIVENGYRDLSRWKDNDLKAYWDNVYWSRLGFRRRSAYLRTLCKNEDNRVLIASHSPENLEEVSFSDRSIPSYNAIAVTKVNLHICHGRLYAANRCFEIMALGSFLLCHEDNEIFDFIPDGLVGKYNEANLEHKIQYYVQNSCIREGMARKGQIYALQELTTKSLQVKLLSLIEKIWGKVFASFNARGERGNALSYFRAPFHHETNWSALYDRLELQIISLPDTALLLNEKGWFFVDKYLKCQENIAFEQGQDLLLKGLMFFLNGIKLSADNLTLKWNAIIASWHLKRIDECRALSDSLWRLIQARTSSGISQFDFKGSKLEVGIGEWFSGHVEAELAFKKIKSDNNWECLALLYRLNLFRHYCLDLPCKDVFWEDLPDEYAAQSLWDKVDDLDPLWRSEAGIQAGITREEYRPIVPSEPMKTSIRELTLECLKSMRSKDFQMLKSYMLSELFEVSQSFAVFLNKYFGPDKKVALNIVYSVVIQSDVTYYLSLKVNEHCYTGSMTFSWIEQKVVDFSHALQQVECKYDDFPEPSNHNRFRNTLMINKLYSEPMKLVGWGTGNYYQLCKSLFKDKLNYLVDGDSNKWGDRIDGLSIFSPDKLTSELSATTMVVVFSTFFTEIEEKLQHLGVENYMSPFTQEETSYVINFLSQSVSFDSCPGNDGKGFGFAFQGPIKGQLTVSLLKRTRNVFPQSIIVLSTWSESDPDFVEACKLYCDQVILNEDLDNPGFRNRNRQSFTTHKALLALKEYGCEFAIKWRTDMVSGCATLIQDLKALWDQYPVLNSCVKGRLIVPQSFTRAYLPYNVSDLLMFGHMDDLLLFWSGDHNNTQGPLVSDHSVWDFCNHGVSPETFFGKRYCQRVTGSISKDLKEALDFVRDYFIVVDDSQLELSWYKPLAYDQVYLATKPDPILKLMDHDFWCKLQEKGMTQNVGNFIDLNSVSIRKFREHF